MGGYLLVLRLEGNRCRGLSDRGTEGIDYRQTPSLSISANGISWHLFIDLRRGRRHMAEPIELIFQVAQPVLVLIAVV